MSSILGDLNKENVESEYSVDVTTDEGLKKVLWRHNGEMEMLHMFAHQLAREVAPDMMITYDDVNEEFQGVEFTYHKYYLY